MQAVELLQLSNVSVLLSWAPPSQSSQPVYKYLVYKSTPVESDRATFYKGRSLDSSDSIIATNQYDRHQLVFSVFPNTSYTFDIIPVSKDNIFGEV